MKFENREEWLEARRHKVMGSEIATVLNMNPYQSQLGLWAEKTGRVPGFGGNSATRIGQALEREVANVFAEKYNILPADIVGYGMEITTAKFEEKFGATLDFFVVPFQTPLQTKTSKIRNRRNWIDGPPIQNVLQCQWEMMVGGFESEFLACMFGADPDEWEEVQLEADQELHGMMCDEAYEFLKCLETDTPPEGVGAYDQAIIKKIYPAQETTIWDKKTSAEVARLVIELEQHKARKRELNAVLKPLDSEQKKIENSLRMLLAGATIGKTENGMTVINKTTSVGEKVVAAYSFDRITVK